jgi:hypothetical protein
MSCVCERCGRTESETRGNAKVLAFDGEFQSGIYSCCQLAQWAREQVMAWLEAASDDGRAKAEAEGVPVRVRLPRRDI